MGKRIKLTSSFTLISEQSYDNPDSRLNLSKEVSPTFNSNLADPNHPAFRGSWITLLSGGKIAPKHERKASRDANKRQRKALKHAQKAGITDANTLAIVANEAVMQDPKRRKRGRKAKAVCVPCPRF